MAEKKLKISIDGLDDIVKKVELLTNSVTDLTEAEQDLTVENQRLIDSQEAVEQSLQSLIDGNAELELQIATNEAKVEKIAESFRQFGEAAALGFNSLDYGSSTIEGLSVAVAGLNASLAGAKDEFERADIEKEIMKIEAAREVAEAKAKQGIFPKGSIGAITNEVELLELQLRALPAGTAEFEKVKKRFDELSLNLENLQLSAEDKKQVFFDLGGSIASTFASGSAALATFGIENEEVEKALLNVQAALVAVEAIRSAVETLKLARQAKSILATQAEATATAELTVATTALGTAQQVAGAGAQTGAKGIKALGQAIKANPILFLVGSIIAIGTALYSLRDKFKPIDTFLTVIEDGIGGVIGAFSNFGDTVFAVVDTVIGFYKIIGSTLLTPLIFTINAAIKAFNALGGNIEEIKNPLGTISENISDLGDSITKIGGSISDGFNAGVDKAQKVRALKDKETLAKIQKGEEEFQSRRLGLAEGNEDAISKLKQDSLKRDAEIASQKLALERGLTDSEINILKSGNSAKIIELKKTLKERGDLTEKTIEDIEALQESQTALLEEQKAQADRQLAAYKESLDAQLKVFNSSKDLEIQRLSNSEKASDKIKVVELNLQKTLEGFRVARLKGEKVLDTDIIAAKEDAANQKVEIEKEEAQRILDIKKDLNESIIDTEIERLNSEVALNEDGTLRRKTQAEQLKDNLIAIQQSTDKELADLEEETQQRLKDNEADSAKILEDSAKKKNLIIANGLKEQQDIKDAAAKEDLAKQEEQAKKSDELLLSNLEKELNLLKSIAEDSTKTPKKRAEARKKATDIEIEQINKREEAEIKALGLTLQQYQILKTDGVEALATAYPNLDKAIIKNADLTVQNNDRAKEILTTQKEIKFSFNELLGPIAAVGESFGGFAGILGKSVGSLSGFVDSIKGSLDSVDKTSQEKTKDIAAAVAGIASTLANVGTEIASQIFAQQEAQLDAQLELFDEATEAQKEKSDERLALLEEEGTERAERMTSLEEQIAGATGETRLEAIRLLDNEKAKAKQVEQEKAKIAEAEKQREIERAELEKKLEVERKEIQRKAAIAQKATAIATSIINTALGVTNVLATVPKVDFGVTSAIQVALTLALGVANTAIIASQPIPQFAEGGYTGAGNRNDPAGIVHRGEYVIPKHIVDNPNYSNTIRNLESTRLRGYATGGAVAPGSDVTDAIRRQTSDLINNQPEIVVSVDEVTRTQSKINKVKSKAII